MSFSERLSLLMENRNVSAYKLSKDTGITQALLGKYKRGANIPSIDKASIIADYFGVTTDYLLGRTDNPNGVVSPHILRITTKDGKELTEEEMQKVIDFAEMVVKARDK